MRRVLRIGVVVSDAAFQRRAESIEELADEDFDRTIKTNVYGLFHLVKAAAPHLRAACTGSTTKGAIHALVQSLATQLAKKAIRVNYVAPGPVWTPLHPADQGTAPEQVAKLGSSTQLGRSAQPEEIAPAFVFLASDADSSFVTGQVIAALGGTIPG